MLISAFDDVKVNYVDTEVRFCLSGVQTGSLHRLVSCKPMIAMDVFKYIDETG